jgi:subtilisin family serine protease
MRTVRVFTPLLLGLSVSGHARPAQEVWFDPAWSDAVAATQPGQVARATVWFDRQLIGEGDAYARRTAELARARRRPLRAAVIDSLQAFSAASWSRAEPVLKRLEADGIVSRCHRLWIVNGFTCDLPVGRHERLAEVPGVRRVFRDRPRPAVVPDSLTGAVVAGSPRGPGAYRIDASRASWSARHLGIDRVWTELGLSGRGVLHVIHDFGWTFAPPPIRATLWRNPGEIAGNGIDDDGNGLIDDVHGFNFDRDDAVLAPRGPLLPGDVTHGDVTAAIAAGRELVDSAMIVGMAPASEWAAVIATLDIARGIQWALEHGADTYSMSFSIPNLGELRAHWRKVADHAALAGLFLMSGAGNFANEQNPNFAPVPVQMRTPEDIPLSVYGVAGVGRDGRRPPFSSQGPVEWRTDAYGEGEVGKPDFATVNTNVIALDHEGRLNLRDGAGWSGNSFAGPHLAGIVALMLEADPDLTPWQARDILVRTARDVPPSGFDPQTGAGVIDAWAAVQAVRARR